MPEVIFGHSIEGMVVVRQQRCSCFVVGEGGRILWIARMGKYVCREQPTIFQQIQVWKCATFHFCGPV